jgi:exodeoxyribonuclease VII large subunit
MSDVLTVSQLTRQIRTLLEVQIGQVWVEGEVSNHRQQTSGHHYFTLKDAGAQISCVLFRGQAARAGAVLTDGAQVQVLGELSVYEPRGQYQMIARNVQLRGQGALQAKFEALKRSLQAEGLFSQDRKRSIPTFPSIIALVTSPTGAAIQDMLNVLTRRAPWLRIIVYPVRVQGQGAEREIAHAITQLNRSAELGLPVPETIIVGRGGGSLEDLWNFNEESVARAIYQSQIPIISAVGHEIDFTIADFVADLRAPTPSAAAELVAPDIEELRRAFDSAERTLKTQVSSVLDHHRQVLDLMAKGSLAHAPERLLNEAIQSIDEAESRWTQASRERLRGEEDRLTQLQQVLGRYHPVKVVADAGHRVQMSSHRLAQAVDQRLRRSEDKVQASAQMLKLIGPQSILARGFSYTTTSDGRVITLASEAKPGDEIVSKLSDGELRSVVR